MELSRGKLFIGTVFGPDLISQFKSLNLQCGTFGSDSDYTKTVEVLMVP